MDFITGDSHLHFRPNISPQLVESSCFPGDINLDQESFLNNTLDISQPGFNYWQSDSLRDHQKGQDSNSTYAAFTSILDIPALQDDDTNYRALELEFEAVYFQPTEFSMYYKANNKGVSDMALENNLQPELSHSTQNAIPSSINICHETGCNNQSFPTNTAFRKHLEKHTRPYACTHLSCNRRRFGTKAGLTRHSREVHSDKIHYCPFRSCARHTDGFARKYNLLKHQETCHDDAPLVRAKVRRRDLQEEVLLFDELFSEEDEEEEDDDDGAAIDPASGNYSGRADGATHRRWQRREGEQVAGQLGSSPISSIGDPVSERDVGNSQPRFQVSEEEDPKSYSVSSPEDKFSWKLQDLKSERKRIDREIAKLERRIMRHGSRSGCSDMHALKR